MPIPLYDRLLQIKLFRAGFDFYAHHVFMAGYDERADTMEYWLSQEALYWYFYTRYKIDTNQIDRVLQIPEVAAFLQDPTLTAVELGFGIGRNYRYLRKFLNLKKYIAVEVNSFACRYVEKEYAAANFRVLNQSIEQFMTETFSFEVLLVFGRVLMYLDQLVLDRLIASLPQRGVRKILILEEGSVGADIRRADGTTMYNFKRRLEAAGYAGHFIEQADAEGVLDVFVLSA